MLKIHYHGIVFIVYRVEVLLFLIQGAYLQSYSKLEMLSKQAQNVRNGNC